MESFELEGTEHVDDAAVKACLATQERPRTGFTLGPADDPQCGVPPFDATRLPVKLWAWPWTDWPLYDEQVFTRDLDRVERFYRARGYYSARVTDVVRLRDEKDREIAVSVQVDEGTPVHIVRLEFSGLEGLRHELRREIERAQKLRVGDVFDEAYYDESKASLLAALREASYAKAEVDGQVELDPIRREAKVQMVVKLGPPCRFGRLNISGQEDLPPLPIWAAADIDEGGPYRPSSLVDAQRALYELGPFASVDVVEQAREGEPVIDVLIKLVPGRRIRFAFGAGMQVGTDSTLIGGDFTGDNLRQWDLHLLGRVEHRNFLGGMRRLSVEERPRLIFDRPFPGTPAPDLGNLLAVEFRQPAFGEPRTSLVASGRWDRGPDPYGGRFLRSDVVAGLGPERRFLGGLLSWSSTLNVNLFVPDKVNDENALNPALRYPNYAVTYFQHSFVLDLRDQPRSPRGGAYFGLTVQHAGYLVPSDWDYVRVTPDVRGYLSLPFGVVLAGRLRVGMMEITRSSIDVPLTGDDFGFRQRLHDLGPLRHRLRGGGHNSVRGYSSNTLGDVVRVGNRLDSGGLRQWETSLELRIPITATIGAVLFLDAGDVTRDKTFRLNEPQTTLGLGLRYKTIVGPIRLDFGLAPGGMQSIGTDERSRQAYDQSSGEPLPEFPESRLFGTGGAIHFTIGEAF